MPEETMLPGAARILERCGLTSVIAEHRFFGQAHHGVRWEEDRIIWTSRPEADRGFQVERRIFDPALRDWARAQGAVVLDGHRVLDRLGGEDQTVVRVQPQDGEPWNLLARTIVVALFTVGASCNLLGSV